MKPETPWRQGRFQSSAGGQRLLFGQMYEDVRIEQEAFAGRSRIFAIASAGCTALALSGNHKVVACDINPVQLAYARRRIDGGGIETGDAERGMSVARMGMPLIGWSEGKVKEFLGLSKEEEQLGYWRANLDTWRFRTCFDLMMSRAVLRLVYSPELLGSLPEGFGPVLRGRLERGFGRHSNLENPYLQSLFLGKGSGAPVRAKGEIELVEDDAASYLEGCEAGSFDGFTISNILDGAPRSYRERLVRAIRFAASEGAMVVHRSFGEPPQMSGNRAADDRALLWGLVAVVDAQSGL